MKIPLVKPVELFMVWEGKKQQLYSLLLQAFKIFRRIR